MSLRRGARDSGGVLSRSTLVWVAILVVVLVVIDVVLVAFALSRTAPMDHGDPGPVPTFTSSPMPSESSSPTPGPTATSGAAGPVDTGRHLLSAVDASEAWRATSRSCSAGGANLEHTTDGGSSWKAVPLSTDVGAVLALRAGAGRLSVLVGVGNDCNPAVRTSIDGGVTWKAGAPGAAGAGIDSAGLLLSSGTVASPCSSPIDAFQGKYTTAVACDDEVQWRSGTHAWVRVPVSGVRSIADNGDAYTIALVGSAGCKGVAIASLPAVGVTAATRTAPVGCANEAANDDAVAVARSGQAVWLWAGSKVLISTDGGTSW
jgi:hypothetical protein